MKNKIIIVLLILSLVFTFPMFSFATDEATGVNEAPTIKAPVEEEVKTEPIEVKQEEPQLEIKQEVNEQKIEQEKTQEPQEIMTKEVQKESKKAITPVEKVTVKLMARTGNGNYAVAQTWTAVKNGSNTWSNANKTANKYSPVSQGLLSYSYTGIWEDTLGNSYTIGESKKGADFISLFDGQEGPTATLEVYAQYEVSSVAKLTFKCDDKIGNGSTSWTNEGAFTKYTHTFIEPPDYPKPQYEFSYWEDYENDDEEEAGDKITIKAKNLTQDTTITYHAIYEYQPALRVVYHYNNKVVGTVGDSYEPIDIYKEAPIKGLTWYYDLEDEDIIDEGDLEELDDTITTDVPLNDITIVHVYAKNIDSVVPDGQDSDDQDSDNPAPITSNKTIKSKVYIPTQIKYITYGMGDGTEIIEQPIIIKKNPLPLSAPQQKYWALLNLLFALATCLLAFVLIIFGILNKKNEDETTEVKNKWWTRIASICIGILSLVIFFITENMNNPWIWIDKWTWLMAIIFIINIIIMIITKHKEKENE